MIILSFSILLHYCLTKTSDLMFIGFHTVQLESFWMVVMMSVRLLPWNNNVHACALTFFVPYPLCKFRITSSFSYWWIWHISVLMLYHLLSADYVRIKLVNLFSFVSTMYPVPSPTLSTLDFIIPPSVSMLDLNYSLCEITFTTFPTILTIGENMA